MSASDHKKLFYRYLLRAGKSDKQAKRIVAYIEAESPVDFFRRVGVDKKLHANVMQLGNVRSLTRPNKALFDEVYRLYGDFIHNSAGNGAQSGQGAVGPGYSVNGHRSGMNGPGRVRRYGYGAAVSDAGLGMAITKIVLLFCMLFALNGTWIVAGGFYGLKLWTIANMGYDPEYVLAMVFFITVLILLIIALIMSFINLFLTIKTTGRAFAGSIASAGALAGFLRFFDVHPKFICLLTGIAGCSFSGVFAAFALSSYWDNVGGAAVFMIVVSAVLIAVAGIDRKTYNYSRF